MNRNFIGNKKPSLQTGCNILNAGKNIDSIEKNKDIGRICYVKVIDLAILGQATFMGGARVVTPFRSHPSYK